MSKLYFGNGNAKLAKGIFTFSLPSGWTCPGASNCLAKANRETGKITDGKNQEYRCFSASEEAIYKNTRDSRWQNLKLLRGKSQSEMRGILCASIPQFAAIVRVHVAGDFFSQAYFNAWMETAIQFPKTLFYAYTKSLHFWITYGIGNIPANFKLTASIGGAHDGLAAKHGLKFALVVNHEKEAEARGLKIDHDDSLAYGQDKPFALLIHGNGPKGSEQAKLHYQRRVKPNV